MVAMSDHGSMIYRTWAIKTCGKLGIWSQKSGASTISGAALPCFRTFFGRTGFLSDRAMRGALEQQSLLQHAVDPFFAVHRLRDMEIHRQRAELICLLPRQVAALTNEGDHFT